MALWRIRATVDDRPGFLSVLTASLALRKVNILSVQVHTTELGAVDEFLVDAPDELTTADLSVAVERGRGRDPWIQPADVHGLVDPPTRALGLATSLIRTPDELAAALATLLGSATVSWRPEPCGGREGYDAHAMRLADPFGGSLLVERAQPVFTPAEYARAHALTAFATALVRRAEVASLIMLPDGREVSLRPADPADVDEILALHDRCSLTSRYRRYLAPRTPSRDELLRLLDGGTGIGLVVDGPHGAVGFGTMCREGLEAELGLLVDDRWQRRRVGTALARRLAMLAVTGGAAVLHGHAHTDNEALTRTMRHLGVPLTTTVDGNFMTVSAQLTAAAGGPVGSPGRDGSGAAG